MSLLGTINPAGNVASQGVRTVASFKQFFFDTPAVTNAAEKGTIRALSKFGAFVRRRAQTSMRKRKNGVSPPGSPPFVKKGLLKKLLFFGYDTRTKTVVVGPAAINSSPVPSFHEFGGKESANGKVIWVVNKPGRNARGQFVSKGKSRLKLTGTIKYPARPFMAPALDAEMPKFADQFAGTITG